VGKYLILTHNPSFANKEYRFLSFWVDSIWNRVHVGLCCLDGSHWRAMACSCLYGSGFDSIFDMSLYMEQSHGA
jgi:hypothetical protein